MTHSLPVIQPHDSASGRKPAWLKVRAPGGPSYIRLKRLLRDPPTTEGELTKDERFRKIFAALVDPLFAAWRSRPGDRFSGPFRER